MTVKEIAARIDAHLKRVEADPDARRRFNFRGASARAAGAWVRIHYATYYHVWSLRKAEAERYLAWLDAGNVGLHFGVPP